MDDDACRLVDDEQMFVLVSDSELPLLRFEAAVDLLANLNLHDLTALKPVALRLKLAVHTDRFGRQQALGFRAGADLRQRGNEAVKPRSAGLPWD